MNLLSTIGAIIVVIIMIPYMIGWWETGNSAVQQRIIANHMTMVMRAANQYVNQHQDTLLSQATATTGPTISIADLISDGLLPDGFQPQNAWLQDYQIYIRQPQNGALQAIVLTTGGRENATDHFLNAVVPGAAALIGGAGGHIPSGVLPGQTENMLQGAGNGWVLNLGTVGIASPGAGHLGAVSTYDSSALGQDFLYRVAVPGQPELNAMQTELDMTDHAIRNVSDLQFEPREITSESCTSTDEQGRIFLDSLQGLYLCRNNSLEIIGDSGNTALMKNATVAKNGDRITKPSCAPGTGLTPAIFTAPAISEAGPDAPPITAIQTWATSVSDTEWQVHLRVQTGDSSLGDERGWVYPADDYGRIMVLAMCVKQMETPTP